MTRVLVDTDVLVDHLRGARRLEVDASFRGCCSLMTRLELFAGRAADEPRVRTLLSGLHHLGIDQKVAEQAGRLCRDSGLHVPDAVIAATAIVHALPLLTRNRRDFSRVDGLTLFEA